MDLIQMIEKMIDALGYPVRDKVTGFEGVATSTSFDLFGCLQLLVTPGVDEDGKYGDSRWFDVTRLTKTSDKRVLVPKFNPLIQCEVFGDASIAAPPGPADKPIQ